MHFFEDQSSNCSIKYGCIWRRSTSKHVTIQRARSIFACMRQLGRYIPNTWQRFIGRPCASRARSRQRGSTRRSAAGRHRHSLREPRCRLISFDGSHPRRHASCAHLRHATCLPCALREEFPSVSRPENLRRPKSSATCFFSRPLKSSEAERSPRPDFFET